MMSSVLMFLAHERGLHFSVMSNDLALAVPQVWSASWPPPPTPHPIHLLPQNKHTLWQDYHPQECQENFFCCVERLVCLAWSKLSWGSYINITPKIIVHSSLLALVLSLSFGLTSPIIKAISVKTTKPSKTFHIWSHGNEKVSWKYLQSPES